MGVKEVRLSWDTEAEWDLGTKVNVDGVSPGNLELTKQDDFTETVLESAEHYGTGTTAVASATFAAKNVTGLTKANGLLKIDLGCTDWSKLSGSSHLEITSSGGADSQEWYFTIPSLGLNITDSFQTFYLDMSLMGSSGGELNVSNINFIRWYAFFSESETIAWRNAEIVQAYEDNGYRIGPEIDLSAIADDVVFSEIHWSGIPNGGAIDVKTRYSLNGGGVWSDWEDCASGNTIPGLAGKDVSNGLLQCGQQLFTNTGNSKGYYTPQLYSLSLKVSGQEHSINLVINSSRSFNMEGMVVSAKSVQMNASRDLNMEAAVTSAKTCQMNIDRAFNMQGTVTSAKTCLLNISREIQPFPISRSATGIFIALAEQLQQQVLAQKNLVVLDAADVNSVATLPTGALLAMDAAIESEVMGLLQTAASLGMDVETESWLTWIWKRTVALSLAMESASILWGHAWRIPGDFSRVIRPDGDWEKVGRPGGSFNRQDRPGDDWNRVSKPTGNWTKQ